MSKPVRASDRPYTVDVIEGKIYIWCSCGRSNKQPFCDGSHSGTDFLPEIYKAPESKTVFFCGCKLTASQPMCDGSHNK